MLVYVVSELNFSTVFLVVWRTTFTKGVSVGQFEADGSIKYRTLSDGSRVVPGWVKVSGQE